MEGEVVLGVPRELLAGGPTWRGVRSHEVEPFLHAVDEHGEFRLRSEVEKDPSWKQVIPYLVLRDGERLFLMKRSRTGGDERLHDRYSIGIGGHVNPHDRDVDGGLRREWREEIEAAFSPQFWFVGLLNDDEDPVGAVHFGMVYVADAAGRRVAVRETDKLEGEFVTAEAVRDVYDKLETWSQLTFDFLVTGDQTMVTERSAGVRVP